VESLISERPNASSQALNSRDKSAQWCIDSCSRWIDFTFTWSYTWTTTWWISITSFIHWSPWLFNPIQS